MDENMQNNLGAPAPPEQNGSAAKAVASMVLGIISVVLCCCFYYAAFPCAIVGLILGALSRKNDERGKGMAVAGIVLSIVALALAILVIVTAGAMLAFLNDYLPDGFEYSF